MYTTRIKDPPKIQWEWYNLYGVKNVTVFSMGDTGRRFGVRGKEHMKDMEQLEGNQFTMNRKKVTG